MKINTKTAKDKFVTALYQVTRLVLEDRRDSKTYSLFSGQLNLLRNIFPDMYDIHMEAYSFDNWIVIIGEEEHKFQSYTKAMAFVRDYLEEK